ncbi:MAG: hypothetical protein A3E87_08080 [Gammaproteobacteria bacterium RIFCSPHIGHO2_12_FULL_35_23]|nr:MAG: hypothetical protein A3E87_08080 [Gammaproteobacteria bacterium RIFCSPHIGHO2_12_FULL_35_23]
MPKREKALQYSEAVQGFSKNFLNKFDLKIIHYGKIYANGKRIVLSNSSQFIEFNYLANVDKRPAGYKTNLKRFGIVSGIIDETLGPAREFFRKNINDEKEVFHVGESIFVNKLTNNYVESYTFISNHEQSNIVQTYFNYQEAFDLYTLTFRDHFKAAIANLEKNPILRSSDVFQEEIKILNPSEEALWYKHPHHYYLSLYGRQIKLTWREVECLSLLMRGRTSLETAELLQISKATVDTYLERAKFKLNAHTRVELFDSLFQADFKPTLFDYLLYKNLK